MPHHLELAEGRLPTLTKVYRCAILHPVTHNFLASLEILVTLPLADLCTRQGR